MEVEKNPMRDILGRTGFFGFSVCALTTGGRKEMREKERKKERMKKDRKA